MVVRKLADQSDERNFGARHGVTAARTLHRMRWITRPVQRFQTRAGLPSIGATGTRPAMDDGSTGDGESREGYKSERPAACRQGAHDGAPGWRSWERWAAREGTHHGQEDQNGSRRKRISKIIHVSSLAAAHRTLRCFELSIRYKQQKQRRYHGSWSWVADMENWIDARLSNSARGGSIARSTRRRSLRRAGAHQHSYGRGPSRF